MSKRFKLITGNAFDVLPTISPKSIQLIIMIPPIYTGFGNSEKMGKELTPSDYMVKMALLFKKLKPLLKDGGTLWAIFRDILVDLKPQDIGEDFTYFLEKDGWYIERSYTNYLGSWVVTAHKTDTFDANYTLHPPPRDLGEIIYRYTLRNDFVLDPFCGNGFLGMEALRYDCRFIGIDIENEKIVRANRLLNQFLGDIGK